MATPLVEDAGIVIIGGGTSALESLAATQAPEKTKITAVFGNPFLEWSLMSPQFLTNPETHAKWVSPNPDDFKMKGVDYIFDAVTQIDPVAKTIKFKASPEIRYKAVIIGTGNKLPLLMPVPGESLRARQAMVRMSGEAIRKAKTIVVYGSGLIGVEMAGDAKMASPQARVILMSRKGDVLGTSHPKDWQEKVGAKLKERGIELMKGSVDKEYLTPHLEPGTATLTDGDVASLAYDVWIPSFQQGPNTSFLADAPGVLNDKKLIIANESLQSTVHPEIFAVGVSTVLANTHPISASVTNQAKTAAANARAFLENKPLKKHVESGNPRPGGVMVAHGEGGYMFWDLPFPVKACCCIPCGGGYPICPPFFCWCCKPGCSGLCGSCCKGGEGEGPSIAMEKCLMPMFASMHHFKGLGNAAKQSPPAQLEMS